MALTRKMLKAMGIDDEKIDQIIDAHTETVDALKEERDNYKKDSEELKGVKKQLDEAKSLIESGDKDAYKVKYDALKEDFDNFKADVKKKETTANKTAALQSLLKEIGISEKRIPAVLKISDVESVELDENGSIKNKSKLADSLKSEWQDFIVMESKKGADEHNPPSNEQKKSYTREDIKKMTPEEINKNWDAVKASLKGE